jgi:hypothetical protein
MVLTRVRLLKKKGTTAVRFGEFLIASNWIMLVYLVAGVALFHRQVLREKVSLTYFFD